MKRIFAFMLSAVMIFGLVPLCLSVSAADNWDGTHTYSFASGSGTERDPFIINTAEQLAYFAMSVNSGVNYRDQFVKLNADIILNDTSAENWQENANSHIWTPIGVNYYGTDNYIKSESFGGTFDGGNHTVKGINVGTEATLSLGFFGYTYGATIKNLKLENVSISGQKYVGGLIGYSLGGEIIENCHVTGAAILGEDYYTGGLLGHSASPEKIENCSVAGIVTGNAYVGGLIGNTYGSESKIKKCENLAIVFGESYVGGIVGNISGSNAVISDCTNNGLVSGTSYEEGGSKSYSIGGIAGSANVGKIVNCSNKTYVAGFDNIGGIVGNATGYSDNGMIIENCVNDGKVRGALGTDGADKGLYGSSGIAGIVGDADEIEVISCVNNGEISGLDTVGGIVGDASGSVIKNCVNNNTVAGIADESNSTYNQLRENFGGIAAFAKNTEIIACSNHAIIGGGEKVGGIVGEMYSYSTNDNELMIVTVKDCYNNGGVLGYSSAGGIVGNTEDGIIENCYNTAIIVVAGNYEYYISVAGSIAGYESGTTFKNCKYLEGTASFGCDAYYEESEYTKVRYTSDVAGVTKLTDAQMKDVANFAGFDFEKVWIMDPDTAYAYPELRAYDNGGMLGDINDNQQIDMTDYILLKRAYFGTYTFDDGQNVRGDINQNGNIDMTDYILLKRVYFGTYTLK